MTEDDSFSLFDPSMKKKKKKKQPVDLELIEDASDKKVDDLSLAIDDMSLSKKSETLDNGSDVIGEFDPSMKKKKKKKTEFDPDAEVVAPTPDNDELGDLDFSTKKKKKKKAAVILDDELDAPGEETVGETAPDEATASERDYTYEELLKRAVDLMNLKNPDLQAGEKKKYVMKPPQVLRHGSKKTSFANFLEIAKMLHRTPKHVQDFLMAELGTSGSIDGYNQLVIKGRFQQKGIEGVLKRYIKEYVTCHTCRSAETLLQKEGRLHFLQCESCGSRCSVQSIKVGFQAVTGKRKQLRDKQEG